VFEVVNPAFPEFPSSQVAPHTPTPPQDVPPPPPAPREAAPQWPASAEAAPPAVPPVPVTPREALPVPVPPAPAGPRPTETTARKEREGMLAAAGMGPGGMPKDVRFSLAFLTGPLASTVRVLDTPVTVIGREEGDLIINDPETSRRHARLEITPTAPPGSPTWAPPTAPPSKAGGSKGPPSWWTARSSPADAAPS